MCSRSYAGDHNYLETCITKGEGPPCILHFAIDDGDTTIADLITAGAHKEKTVTLVQRSSDKLKSQISCLRDIQIMTPAKSLRRHHRKEK